MSSTSITREAFIDLFRSNLVVSSKVFKVAFFHLVYNPVLFLASCCFSFLLPAVASLICIFLVSRQLVLISTLPKFLHSSCILKNFTSIVFNLFILFF